MKKYRLTREAKERYREIMIFTLIIVLGGLANTYIG